MAKALEYKGHPLQRKDNFIYYGSFADKYARLLRAICGYADKYARGHNMGISMTCMSYIFKTCHIA